MTGRHPRGACAHCGEEFAVITGGVIGAHTCPGQHRCPGAGQPPSGTELAALVARLAEVTANLQACVEAGVRPDGGVLPLGEEMMSPTQVAKAFNRSGTTIRRWAREGRLTPIRTPGGGWLYRRSEIERLLRGEADPTGLTLVLPDGLTETEVLRGLAEAIQQVYAALAGKAARFQKAAEGWRHQGDQFRESLCEVQARVCEENASCIDQEIVQVFDLGERYPARFDPGGDPVSGSSAELERDTGPGDAPRRT